jgi:hypothetical protein
MDDDSRVVDKGWDLPEYAEQTADDAVTLSISTSPADWLVNTMDSVVVPMSTADVVEALRIHKLTDRSLVWRNGMPEWTSIDRVPSLKLAARMPATLGPSKPTKPSRPPTPIAGTPTPSLAAATNAAVAPSQPPPGIGLSRRSTMPFGMTGPNPSRPAHAKPSSPPSAPAPAPRSEEPEALAVYERPAATISFDLSPSEPARVPPPAAERSVPARPAPTPPPQTLAPTTTDTRSAPHSAPPPPPRAYNPDLSVVAASHFRSELRSSKRKLLVSSLASAAAASALTLWLSGAAPWSRVADSKAPPRAPEAPAALAAAAPPPAAAPAPAPAAVTPPAAQMQSAPAPAAAPATTSAPLAQAMAAALVVPKPAAPKAKPVSAPATPRASGPARTAQREPKGDGNPYDVKLDDESGAQPAGKPPARGLLEMMQESERPAPQPAQPEASAATGTNSPGF